MRLKEHNCNHYIIFCRCSDSDSDDSSADSSPPSKRTSAAAKRTAAANAAKSLSRTNSQNGNKQSCESTTTNAATVAKMKSAEKPDATATANGSTTAALNSIAAAVTTSTTSTIAATSITANATASVTSSAHKVPVRKLTRSSSTRKSKHLTAIFNPAKASDTDSGAEAPGGDAGDTADSKAQRALSKSPVKRTPGTNAHAGGNGNHSNNNLSKSGSKTKSNSRANHKPAAGAGSPQKRSAMPATAVAAAAAAAAAAATAATSAAAAVAEERRCPIDGCDSNGHLAGNLAKHFTPEACPLWHGVTLAETRLRAEERQRRDAERIRAGILYEPDKKQLTVEQKAYQLRIRDVRSKFVPTPVSPSVRPPPTSYTYRGHRGGGADAMRGGEPQHEPNLTGLVSDYDLQLFREAQAVASERIEDELRVLPAGKGTKYVFF